MLAASVAGSSCESTTTSSTVPSASAAACAPSRRVTKNGLFSVESDRPSVSFCTRRNATGIDASTSSPFR